MGPAYYHTSDRLEFVQRFAAKDCTKRWSASSSDLLSSLNSTPADSDTRRFSAGELSETSQSSNYSHIFIPSVILIPALAIPVRLQFLMLVPPSNLPLSYLPVVYGIAFLTLWSP